MNDSDFSKLPMKPLYTRPCNHCGLCCRLELCPVAEVMFEKEQSVQPPCPALFITDSKAYCGLVIGEKAVLPKNRQLISSALGIGTGCSMADASTTEEQIRAFNAISEPSINKPDVVCGECHLLNGCIKINVPASDCGDFTYS